MGSRYGGLKQMDPMGPNGESLLDYSVFDAKRAGFESVTFVIRRDFEELFKQQVGRRYEGHMEVRYVFQQLDELPGGHKVPVGREKPWGTTHAIWCARDVVKEPFAAINADDFYGADAYRKLCDFLSKVSMDATPAPFAMVGFQLGRTLSDHGTVSRGVCQVDDKGMLTHILEYTKIEKSTSGAEQNEAPAAKFSGLEPVSMNFWGFTPAVFPMLESELLEFLGAQGAEMKSEVYIPNTVGQLTHKALATCRVLETDSEWFGVTYREDKPVVQESIRRLIAAGLYPQTLTA